jgi:arylsulfatase A
MQRNRNKPFLVYYPMILTHCPFHPTPDSSDWDPTDKGSTDYKGDPKYFGDMVTYMDKIIGKLIAKLEELGLRENTLILFTGDNGTDMPVVTTMNGRNVAGGKGLTTDAGTRVPLIANWPDIIPTGQICNDLIDFSDFLPTLCETANVDIPSGPNIDGRSFLPQLKGLKGNPRDWIYCWYSRSGDEIQAEVFARTQRYKLYQTGFFYDIQNDVMEQTPLHEDKLDQDTKQIKRMLQNVIDKYKIKM